MPQSKSRRSSCGSNPLARVVDRPAVAEVGVAAGPACAGVAGVRAAGRLGLAVPRMVVRDLRVERARSGAQGGSAGEQPASCQLCHIENCGMSKLWIAPV